MVKAPVKKLLLISIAMGAFLILCSAGVLLYYLVTDQPQMLATREVDTMPPMIAEPLARPAVLVFSKTYGYRHKAAIGAGEALFGQLANRNGWAIVFTENAAVFNVKQLAQFDVVIWNCASKPSLTKTQQQAFQAYIESGSGFVGIHAAGDSSHASWPWYQQQVIGAEFIGHPIFPQFQTAQITVEQSQHPAMIGLPGRWQHKDEWYSFAQSPRGKGVEVLATVDENTYKPGRSISGRKLAMGADHPVIWVRSLGAGRVFYTALGHKAETFQSQEFQQNIEQAIRWVGRLD